jgi:hypothetical protein
MTQAAISLYALAALIGVAPAMLRATLTRAGVRLSPDERTTESDLARVFGIAGARALIERKCRANLPRRPGLRSQPGDRVEEAVPGAEGT